jgi:hypothetical protein
MSSPSDDDADSELSKFAPKWSRVATPKARLIRSPSTRKTSAAKDNMIQQSEFGSMQNSVLLCFFSYLPHFDVVMRKLIFEQ